jgi:hypothetical protein
MHYRSPRSPSLPVQASHALVVAVVAFLGHSARAEPSHSALKPGDAFEITLDRESSTHGSDSSSSTTGDRFALVERVTAVREDGTEVEYDFAKETPAGDRASEWRFPARVFEPFSGPMRLLNAAELEGRVDGWLKSAGLTRAACGHWIFTWNAFQIECDPQSVIESLVPFDLDAIDVQDGAVYRDPAAHNAAPLTRENSGPDGATFVANLAIDPDVVRRGRAQTDVVANEMVKHQTETVDEALRQRAGETINGTISVTIETNALGRVRKKTTVTTIEIKSPSGRSEPQTVTEIVDRRPLVSSGS